MKDYMDSLENMEMFEKYWTGSEITVFVFSAEWCPDCQFIKPFIGRLIEKYREYHFIYVDRDQWIEVAQRLNVLGIPSFIGVRDSKEINRFVSKLRKTEAEIDQFLGDLKCVK